jgi:hypothetical protein
MLAADQYMRGMFQASVSLPAGVHPLRIRARVKA